ncbi:hypothetical protein [Mycolicibacterium sp. D5.8-2]|uniref:hypothetical protein n=1 Tax=Mycolicibacterium sp. D5.8-2 TaxID=3085903 RepID=UPI00298C7741|nr:hypothetical protein [Mycolicibacterium sp. D5.8-2]MDW5615077.1 hypothetical protein [Mycolicibacterium sp. D5.8-2]
MTPLERTLSLASMTPWARKWGVSSKTPLDEWPLVSRDDLVEDPDQFVVPGWPRFARRIVRTGGSSGQPLGLWLDRFIPVLEAKHQLAQWGRIGFRRGDWRLVLRGSAPRQEELFFINTLRREIHTSTFHLTECRLEELVRSVPIRKRLWLHAYPSSALELVRMLRLRGEGNPFGFLGVLLGSENSSWEQRDVISAHFGVPTFSWYGLTEKVVLAGECRFSRQYHVNDAYGHVELVTAGGAPVTSSADPARIIATGFMNLCAPLVRYDTGDIAFLADDACGCSLPGVRLANVVGRAQDFLETAEGTRVSVAALNLHGDEYKGLVRLQYVQKAAGDVYVRVMAPTWGSENVRLLEDAIRLRLPGSTVHVEIVERVMVGPNGKAPLVVREVNA